MKFPLKFPLYYILPQGVTNPDKGKNEGTICPADICSVPTEAKLRQQNHIKHYNTKHTEIGKLIEMLSKTNKKRTDKR